MAGQLPLDMEVPEIPELFFQILAGLLVYVGFYQL